MIFGREPAFWIGFIAAAILAVLSVATGRGLIGTDVYDTFAIALDPNVNGWLLPIILGLVTRFFVSPAVKPGF